MWTAKTDQTGRMPRLIWVFAGRTLILLVLPCHGSSYQFDRLVSIRNLKFLQVPWKRKSKELFEITLYGMKSSPRNWTSARQNQQDDLCIQWRLISPAICPVWSVFAMHPVGSQGPKRTAKTDQTGRVPRMLWVFAGHTGHFAGFVVLRLNCFWSSCDYWMICLQVFNWTLLRTLISTQQNHMLCKAQFLMKMVAIGKHTFLNSSIHKGTIY